MCADLLQAWASGSSPSDLGKRLQAQELHVAALRDRKKARGLLRKHLGPTRLVPRTEGPDRHYLATGAFDLSVLVRTSCGGRI